MKAALYARVSTDDQTPENQLIMLKEHAERQGWDYEVFQETESTRKTRPVKNALLQRLRRKEFDILIIYKLDRWARSSQELILDLTELHDKGINILSLMDNIDFSTAAGKLQFQILSAFAEFERNIIRERTLAGLERARRQGKTLGRPKGSKDKKKRKKGGYYLRHMKGGRNEI